MITSEKIAPWVTGFTLGILILSIFGSIFFSFLFEDRIYPGIKIDQIHVGGLTKDQTQATSISPITTANRTCYHSLK